MITIRNTNDKFGDQTEFTAETLEGAVEQLQSGLRACGPEFDGVVVTEDDYEVVTQTYIVSDEQGNEVIVEADSPRDAAREYVDTGNWDEVTCTCFIHLSVRLESDEDGWEQIRITQNPTPPPCKSVEEHEWTSPWRIVGGLKENPGVWGNGGGVRITEVCQKCGCGKNTDTWATDPYDGSQGNTIVSYEQDQFCDE